MTATQSPPYRIDPLSDHHDWQSSPRESWIPKMPPPRVLCTLPFLKLLAGSRRMFLPITEIAALFA